MNPKVSQRSGISAIVPVFNSEKWLARSLESITGCMGSHDEIILIDDFSTDSSKRIMSDFARKDIRIRVFENKRKGLVNALNYGISLSKHSIIARFDSDDLYKAERIDLQYSILDEKVALVFSDYSFIDEHERSLGTLLAPRNTLRAYVSLAASRRTPHPVAMFLKTAFYEVGGYLENDYPNEDLSLWLRIGLKYEISSVPESLLKYRIHPNAISSKFSKSQKNGVALTVKRYFSIERFRLLQQEHRTKVRGHAKTGSELTLDLLDDLRLLSYYPRDFSIFRLFAKDLFEWFAGFPNTSLAFIKLYREAKRRRKARLKGL